MQMTKIQTFVTILAIALGAIVTRFLPFILFPEHKKTPEIIIYLGNVLPPAMMGLLVIYCLKGITIQIPPHGIPELAAIFIIIVLHRLKNNVLLSIGGGTLFYMWIIQALL